MFTYALFLDYIIIIICSVYYSYKYKNNIFKFIISFIVYGFAFFILFVPGVVFNIVGSSFIVNEETSDAYECLDPNTWCMLESVVGEPVEQTQKINRIKESYKYREAFRAYSTLYPFLMLLTITFIKNSKYGFGTMIALTILLFGIYGAWAFVLLK